jgi:hypothetical protein
MCVVFGFGGAFLLANGKKMNASSMNASSSFYLYCGKYE